jgi:thymidine phosphorylase
VPGNKISLLVVPIVAANGFLIPKTSSRAITGAGGTADLMEVLCPVEFTSAEVKEITEKVGGALKVLESMEGPNSLIEKSASLAGILLEIGGTAPRDHGK